MYRGTKWVDHAVDPVTGALVQQGTPQSAGNFNKIEQGIADAAISQAIALIAAEQMGAEVKGKKATRTARFVVGTATNGWTLNDCDFLCDGTRDDVEINAAIQALPDGGGEIVILDGGYTLSASVIINKDNVTLKGKGSATELIRGWKSYSGQSNGGALICVSAHGATVAELKVNNGYDTSFAYQDSPCIYMNGAYSDITINRVVFVNTYYAAKLAGESGEAARNIRIENNKLTGNDGDMKYCSGFEIRNVEGLIFKGNVCKTGAFFPQVITSTNITCTDNIAEDVFEYGMNFNRCENLTVSGNVFSANAAQQYGFMGVSMNGGKNCTINHNVIDCHNINNSSGITAELFRNGDDIEHLDSIAISGNIVRNAAEAIEVREIQSIPERAQISITYNICENSFEYGIFCTITNSGDYDKTSDIPFSVNITGNTCTNTAGVCIECDGGIEHLLASNTCIGGTRGIQALSLRYANIVGNICRNTNYTIFIGNIGGTAGHESKNNLIADNQLFGKNYTNSGSTGDTFINNKYS